MIRLKHHILLRIILILVLCVAMGFTIQAYTHLNDYFIWVGAFLLFIIILSFILESITKPLKSTIKKLKEINLTEEEIDFGKSTIREYNELIKELDEYSSLTKEQYMYQRQYSENLSHELLTPLAVIRTKTELILQNPNLRESDLVSLDRILQTVSRLSKVNQALILLSKIDNNQFMDEEELDLKEVINDSLENFEDQIRKRQLTVRMDLGENVTLKSNSNLLHILIMNLIKNSVFHNVENGTIQINLNNNSLIIRNTGVEANIDTDEFFQRFISQKKTTNSIGLGLAIVKQICTFLEYDIVYHNQGIHHEVVLTYKD